MNWKQYRWTTLNLAQDTIAHSSIETEFTPTFDAGKLILFFRSFPKDLNNKHMHQYSDGALIMAMCNILIKEPDTWILKRLLR